MNNALLTLQSEAKIAHSWQLLSYSASQPFSFLVHRARNFILDLIRTRCSCYLLCSLSNLSHFLSTTSLCRASTVQYTMWHHLRVFSLTLSYTQALAVFDFVSNITFLSSKSSRLFSVFRANRAWVTHNLCRNSRGKHHKRDSPMSKFHSRMIVMKLRPNPRAISCIQLNWCTQWKVF